MSPDTSKESPVLLIKDIVKILPHRYPFLLVDRVLKLDLENNFILAQKNLSINEQFFQGHFGVAPLMPGVLIIEALAQTGGILIHKKGYQEKIAVLMSIYQAKFRRPVLPGDILYMHVQGIHFGNRGGKIEAKAKVNDQLVAEAEIGFGMMELDTL